MLTCLLYPMNKNKMNKIKSTEYMHTMICSLELFLMFNLDVDIFEMKDMCF